MPQWAPGSKRNAHGRSKDFLRVDRKEYGQRGVRRPRRGRTTRRHDHGGVGGDGRRRAARRLRRPQDERDERDGGRRPAVQARPVQGHGAPDPRQAPGHEAQPLAPLQDGPAGGHRRRARHLGRRVRPVRQQVAEHLDGPIEGWAEAERDARTGFPSAQGQAARESRRGGCVRNVRSLISLLPLRYIFFMTLCACYTL
ncbi:hypothetical protein FOCC_FOCC006703 [Frankliniella occidentalis]|nr:hypothetical protein FOCC_FOCC006703 [Frankliniella occidentalis]